MGRHISNIKKQGKKPPQTAHTSTANSTDTAVEEISKKDCWKNLS